MPRLDLILVARNFASSRTKAQHLISAGRVLLGAEKRPVLKASQIVDEAAEIEIIPDESDTYVSRGGLKMAGALEVLALNVHDFSALDLGISTGGFTDCLLKNGAKRVLGVEVGHGQLAEKLKNEPRILLFEGVNARQLNAAELIKNNSNELFDLIVGDVSFISLTLIIPNLSPLLKRGGHLLLLVKPQFEVGRQYLGGGGIVRDESLYKMVEEKIKTCAENSGFHVLNYFKSSILGGDGNREFFIYATLK